MTKDDEDDEFTRIEMEQRMRQEWTPNDMACRPNGLAQTAQGIRPVESDYLSHVAYTRALEVYCDNLEKPAQEPVAQIERLITAEQFAEYFHPRTFLCTCGKSYNLPQEKSLREPVLWGVKFPDGKFSPYAYWAKKDAERIAAASHVGSVAAPLQEQQSRDKRPWVSLTDDEFDSINPKLSLFQFHKAIEAKLKSKNA
jgi:hypothetical protein